MKKTARAKNAQASPEEPQGTSEAASSDYVPLYPTAGWMMSELERRGVRVRGTPLATDEPRMIARLRAFGLEVRHVRDRKAADDR